MTGFPGERRNRTVALVTDDFVLYHRLAPYLESYGIKVLGLRPGETVPASVKVLLGGPPDDARSVALRDDAEATLLAVLAALDRRPRRGDYQRVVFGVDPGQVIGLAVLADGEALFVAEARSPDDAARRVAAWSSGLSAKTWEVHVGDGSPAVGRQLVAKFREALPHAAVHLVHEGDTTPWSAATGSRHADAAIHIALREPRAQA